MFKARMKFAKEGRAKYISHLDLMHAMQRAMARCQMPMWFTEGFNQHAYVSIALPLSTGFSSECEFLDFNITSESVPENAVEAMNDALPEGLRAIEIYPLEDGGLKVGRIAWSQYRITWSFENSVPAGFAETVRQLFAQPVVEILKRSKRGEKVVNMRDLMHDLSIDEQAPEVFATVVTAAGNNSMSPEYLTRAVQQYLPQYEIPFCAYHRLNVLTEDGQNFR
ncbi:TIGR03936 family radical SAM-associated protein [Agathobaculum sp.]|uniref:TIGR03936 family radical SAM-associated protein n=1 Tax=Agathobaculum sp. TaxID=2048138 RepID=UPI002A833B42|nr:TIGR03936 family radical SAM-associated protein [Agathobaculum sp.]MDY3618073.1 TIGR03936 family radical SAM-associated protein [Agathobaculum sp.]